jgi:tRNA-splicing ligase RtcB
MAIFKKTGPFSFTAEREGEMKVPAEVIASDTLMQSLKESKNEGSLKQLLNVAMMPGIIWKALAMPDVHQGYGFPIGGVAAFDAEEGLVSPGGVGYDINCGIMLLKTDLDYNEVKPKITEIVDRLFSSVPTGNNKSGMKLNGTSVIEEIAREGCIWAEENGYCTSGDRDRMEDRGSLPVNSSSPLSASAKSRGMNQLLSIGGGNHFIEVQKVDRVSDQQKSKILGVEEGQVMIMIHTGSRGLGHQVATDFMQLLSSKPEGSVIHPKDPQLISAHIKSRLAGRYLDAMNAAANFASVNRALIMWKIRKIFSDIFRMDEYEISPLYSLSHNMAKIENHNVDGNKIDMVVHRKGATRAFGPSRFPESSPFSLTGQPVIVPGDMGTASYLLSGNDNNDCISLESACHGAGRIMSRHTALSSFRYSDIIADLKKADIVARAATNNGLVEESPGNYKNIDEVVRVAAESGISGIVCRMKPMGVIKG